MNITAEKSFTPEKINYDIKLELDKLNAYFLQKDPDDEFIGLYKGASGACLLMAQNYLATNDEVFLNKTNEFLEYIMNLIESQEVMSPTYSSGIAGWGWLIQYLSKKNVIDSDSIEMLSYFDNILFLRMNEFLETEDNDLLNGAMGIGRYFIVREQYHYVEGIINYLVDTQIKNEQEIKWRRVNWHKEGHYCYDLGLAHGAAGIVSFLITCYKFNILREVCEPLIRGGINFLLNNCQNVKDAGCFFPNVYDTDDYENNRAPHFSRLAWCYGDIGIWYIIYKTAVMLNDAILVELAINSLKTVSTRKSYDETLIVDACFCHGSAGIAYIFNKLGKETGIIEFVDAGVYWLKVTLDYGKSTTDNSGYKFLLGNFEDRTFIACDDLLEGLAGVAITYFNHLHPELNDWDDCLLLHY